MHVAVIGSGSWCRPHLEALTASPFVGAITLVGRNPQSVIAMGREFGGVQTVVGHWLDALADPRVEVVDLILPHHLHAEVAHRALEAGKHVICEKPASLSLTDWDSLHAVARRVDRRFFVVMNQLYDPRVQSIGKAVRDGVVGRPFLLVENNYSAHAASYRSDGWRTRRAQAGGGVLIDGGYHMVYKHLAWLAPYGNPLWVQATAAQLNVGIDSPTSADQGEDFVSYTAAWDGALRLQSSHAWTLAANPKEPRIGVLAGDRATLQWDRCDDLLLHSPDERAVQLAAPAPSPREESLKACLTDYMAAIAESRPPQYGSSALARTTLQLILSVYTSAREGRRIALGPDAGELRA